LEYARSPVVYKTLRETLGPYLKPQGFRRVRGTSASWSLMLEDGRAFKVGGFVNSYGGGDIGGGDFDINLIVGPPGGVIPLDPVRSEFLTRCLVEHELKALRILQSRINVRRPMSPTVAEWIALGDRRHVHNYEPITHRFTVGSYRPLSYFSAADVEEFAQFVLAVLPELIPRFLEDRCPLPVYVADPDISNQYMVLPPRTDGADEN
jgi:hypothetical protein